MPIIETIQKEWAVIRGAPWSIAILAAIICGALWFFLNLINNGALSAKDATIETLRTEVEAYKNKLSVGTPEEAGKKISELEARLIRLEPRKITEDQKRTISAVVMQLTGDPQALIMYDMSCPDCEPFAAGFKNILDHAHWKTIMGSVLGPAQASPTGIAIETPDPLHPLPEAEGLARALREAKVPFELKAGGGHGGLPPTEMLVTVRSSF